MKRNTYHLSDNNEIFISSDNDIDSSQSESHSSRKAVKAKAIVSRGNRSRMRSRRKKRELHSEENQILIQISGVNLHQKNITIVVGRSSSKGDQQTQTDQSIRVTYPSRKQKGVSTQRDQAGRFNFEQQTENWEQSSSVLAQLVVKNEKQFQIEMHDDKDITGWQDPQLRTEQQTPYHRNLRMRTMLGYEHLLDAYRMAMFYSKKSGDEQKSRHQQLKIEQKLQACQVLR